MRQLREIHWSYYALALLAFCSYVFSMPGGERRSLYPLEENNSAYQSTQWSGSSSQQQPSAANNSSYKGSSYSVGSLATSEDGSFESDSDLTNSKSKKKKSKKKKKKKSKKKTASKDKKKSSKDSKRNGTTVSQRGPLAFAPFGGQGAGTANSGSSDGTNGGNSDTNEADGDEEELDINTVEAWQDPIFVEESFDAVNDLLRFHDGKQVSSQVFYDVVGDMSRDERPLLREYGVFALGSTLGTRSFTELTWVKNFETDRDIQDSANGYLRGYSATNRLNHVVGALEPLSEEHADFVYIDALDIVHRNAQRFSGGQLDDEGDPLVSVQGVENQLLLAADLIETHHLQSENGQVRTRAQRTLTEIERQTQSSSLASN